MKNLVEAEARIIIVNVDDQYAPQLVKAAHELGLNAKRGYMWIWRGWPFKNDLGATVSRKSYSIICELFLVTILLLITCS